VLALLSFRHNPLNNFHSKAAQRRQGGKRMPEALQINVALWGMILCSAMKAAQWIEFPF
jgi:hypothetical protein